MVILRGSTPTAGGVDPPFSCSPTYSVLKPIPICSLAVPSDKAKMAVFREEFVQALALLAQACDAVARKGFDRPILVGGAAVEFHTGSALVSGDFDFVADDQLVFEEALIECGFRREDRAGRLLRGLYHPEMSLGVEVVSGSLFDGHSDIRRVQLVEIIDGKSVAIAPVEDLIADRMGQYVSTRPPEMRDQAIKLFQLADVLDEGYLDERIRTETSGEFGLKDLKEWTR